MSRVKYYIMENQERPAVRSSQVGFNAVKPNTNHTYHSIPIDSSKYIFSSLAQNWLYMPF